MDIFFHREIKFYTPYSMRCYLRKKYWKWWNFRDRLRWLYVLVFHLYTHILCWSLLYSHFKVHRHRKSLHLEVCYCFFFIISGQLPRRGEGWMAKQGNSASIFGLHMFIEIKPVISCIPDPCLSTTPFRISDSSLMSRQLPVTTHTPAEQKLCMLLLHIHSQSNTNSTNIWSLPLNY